MFPSASALLGTSISCLHSQDLQSEQTQIGLICGVVRSCAGHRMLFNCLKVYGFKINSNETR